MRKYDLVLRKHCLKNVNDTWRYLSPKIPNKFLYVLGNHMKENIVA